MCNENCISDQIKETKISKESAVTKRGDLFCVHYANVADLPNPEKT